MLAGVGLAIGCSGTSGDRPTVNLKPPPAGPSATVEAREAPAVPELAIDHFEPDPEATRSFLESIGAPAQTLAADVSPPRVPLLALVNTARGEVEAPAADVEVWSARLETGQRASRALSVPQGVCVTAVGQGGLGVTEIDLFLTVDRDGEPVVIGADRGSGPMAVLGGKAGCVRSPAGGLEAELSVRVRAGSGLVLVRLYQE